MFRHVRLKKTALLLLALTPSFVVAADDNIQPPSLLGVWYGTYDDSSDADPASAEMWMGVYWQLSEDGWDVRGHNRWHVLAEPEAETFGGSSLGKQAEHFDSFSGSIARDRQHVILNEDGRGSRIEAVLLSDDSMKARFFQKAQSTPAFEVTLTRINTHYKPSDRAVLGSTRYAAFYDNELYLFVDDINRKAFKRSPDNYVRTRVVLNVDQIETVTR